MTYERFHDGLGMLAAGFALVTAALLIWLFQ